MSHVDPSGSWAQIFGLSLSCPATGIWHTSPHSCNPATGADPLARNAGGACTHTHTCKPAIDATGLHHLVHLLAGLGTSHLQSPHAQTNGSLR